jgi:hypothetical protein
VFINLGRSSDLSLSLRLEEITNAGGEATRKSGLLLLLLLLLMVLMGRLPRGLSRSGLRLLYRVRRGLLGLGRLLSGHGGRVSDNLRDRLLGGRSLDFILLFLLLRAFGNLDLIEDILELGEEARALGPLHLRLGGLALLGNRLSSSFCGRGRLLCLSLFLGCLLHPNKKDNAIRERNELTAAGASTATWGTTGDVSTALTSSTGAAAVSVADIIAKDARYEMKRVLVDKRGRYY